MRQLLMALLFVGLTSATAQGSPTNAAWIILGEGGQFKVSSNMPPQFSTALQNHVQNEHWIIANIYFAPSADGQIIIGADGGMSWFWAFPSDFAAAAWSLKQASGAPRHYSWSGDGGI